MRSRDGFLVIFLGHFRHRPFYSLHHLSISFQQHYQRASLRRYEKIKKIIRKSGQDLSQFVVLSHCIECSHKLFKHWSLKIFPNWWKDLCFES